MSPMMARGRGQPSAGRSPVFRSLRFRMALSHGAVRGAIVVVLGSVGYALLARNLDSQAPANLITAANEQIDRIDETHSIGAPPDTDAPSSSSIRLAVFLPDGSVVGERSDVPGW